MLGVRRMFEVLLQMNERAGRLDQSLEKVCVGRFGVEPKLLQDIVRLVVALLVPATEKREVIRVSFHVCLVRVHIFPSRFGHHHCEILSRLFIGSFNLVAAQRMSKPRTTNSSEGPRPPSPVLRAGKATQGARGLVPQK